MQQNALNALDGEVMALEGVNTMQQGEIDTLKGEVMALESENMT